MGTWQSAGGDDFAIIRRHRPSVVIDLDGHPEFQRVILTTRHGLALVQALRLDVDATEKPPMSSTSRRDRDDSGDARAREEGARPQAPKPAPAT